MSFKILSCKKRTEKPKEKIVSGGNIFEDEHSSDAGLLLCCLYRQLSSLLESKPVNRRIVQQNEAEDSNYEAPFWIIKWARSSGKNGFCYELSDRSVGVLFDDGTQFTVGHGGQQAQYIDKTSKRRFAINDWPEDLRTKKNLADSFCKRAGNTSLSVTTEFSELETLPRLRLWRTTSSALIMQLTDGTVQVNFLAEHTKMIFSPSSNSVSLVDSKRNVKTFRLQLLEKYGCGNDLLFRVHYVKRLLEMLISESEDCVQALSQDGYEIRSSTNAAATVLEKNFQNADENFSPLSRRHSKK